MNISYVNHASVPATAVKFAFRDGRYAQDITAKGTFSPGIAIKQSFTLDDAADGGRSATCSVAEVDFADGTTWHAGPNSVAQAR